jgi:tetratricopeptide (TPR) repeat protein
MNYLDLLQGLEKINIDEIKKLKKLSQNDLIAYEIFNSALDNMRYGNEDIATIKLKKVVSLQPDFEEAQILLKRVMEFEKEKMTEFRSSSSHLKEEKTKTAKAAPVQQAKPAGKRMTLPERLDISPRVLMKIILSAVMLVFLTLVLFIGYKLVSGIKPAASPENQYTQEDMDLLNQTISGLEAENANLQNTVDWLNRQLDEKSLAVEKSASDTGSLSNRLDLYVAKAYFFEGEYSKAVNSLLNIDPELLDADETLLYNDIKTSSYKEAAKSLYTIALNLFNQADYENALKNFLLVLEYDPEFKEKGQCLYNTGKTYYEMGRAHEAIETYKQLEMTVPLYNNKVGILYHSAKAYALTGDKQKAVELFNKVITEYPNSSLVGYAKDRLNELAG